MHHQLTRSGLRSRSRAPISTIARVGLVPAFRNRRCQRNAPVSAYATTSSCASTLPDAARMVMSSGVDLKGSPRQVAEVPSAHLTNGTNVPAGVTHSKWVAAFRREESTVMPSAPAENSTIEPRFAICADVAEPGLAPSGRLLARMAVATPKPSTARRVMTGASVDMGEISSALSGMLIHRADLPVLAAMVPLSFANW